MNAADAWLDTAAAEGVAPAGIVERVRRRSVRKTQLELDLDGADDAGTLGSFAELPVDRVDARRDDPDLDLAGAGRRLGDVPDLELVDSAEPHQDCGSHEVGSS